MIKAIYIAAIIFFIIACTTRDNSAFLYICISIVLFLLGSLIQGTREKRKDFIE